MNDQTTTTELPPTVAGIRVPTNGICSSRQRSRRAASAKWVLLLIVLVAAAGAATHWYLTKDEVEHR